MGGLALKTEILVTGICFWGQELVPITGMDKNIVRLPIRYISKHLTHAVTTSLNTLIHNNFYIVKGKLTR